MSFWHPQLLYFLRIALNFSKQPGSIQVIHTLTKIIIITKRNESNGKRRHSRNFHLTDRFLSAGPLRNASAVSKHCVLTCSLVFMLHSGNRQGVEHLERWSGADTGIWDAAKHVCPTYPPSPRLQYCLLLLKTEMLPY